MSEHPKDSTATAGPWRLIHDGDVDDVDFATREYRWPFQVVAPDDTVIVDFTGGSDVSEADARLIASSWALHDALEQNASINAAMVAWLEDAEPDCSAGNPDGGGSKECDHCIVRGMVQVAQDALELASAALSAAAQPAATSEEAP